MNQRDYSLKEGDEIKLVVYGTDDLLARYPKEAKHPLRTYGKGAKKTYVGRPHLREASTGKAHEIYDARLEKEMMELVVAGKAETYVLIGIHMDAARTEEYRAVLSGGTDGRRLRAMQLPTPPAGKAQPQ